MTGNSPIIQINDISATFPNGNGGLQALEKISFQVQSQEFLCVLGPSGSGKSTLLKLIAGLLVPTSGLILYKSRSLASPGQGIGFVFQKANLLPWRTVYENITLPLELDHQSRLEILEKAGEMIDLVGLTGFENMYPRELSGGMEQKVAIARALIHDPDVLLLDEPFGSLDALTRERMGGELLRIWQARRKTVVMVTHSISEALFLSDRVLVLSQRPGQIRLDLDVPLPRPRLEDMRYTEVFGRMVRQLRSAIGDEDTITIETGDRYA